MHDLIMEDSQIAVQLSLLLLLLRIQKLKRSKTSIVTRRRNRKLWARKWLLRRNEGLGISSLVLNELRNEDPSSFRNFTRTSTATFHDLLAKISHNIQKQDTSFRECISAKIRLLVTLRYLATGETLQSLSYTFRISEPALSLLIPDTVDAIYNALKRDYLKTPRKTEEWKNIANKFYELWQFPNCLGALDGKHIAFRARRKDGSFYYNYKGFHSIILLALVDAEYNFIYVDVGCNGRVNDSGVYNNSQLSKAVDDNLLNFPEDSVLPNSNVKVPYVIVGDDAFRLSKRIMKPCGQRSNDREKTFNYRLSRCRRVVENAFGILANRFQILQRDINLSVDKVQKITLTCCALHNYIKKKDGQRYISAIDVENTNSVTLTPGTWRQNVYMTDLQRCKVNRAAVEPLEIRKAFLDYFNDIGPVPWQQEAIRKFNF